MPITINGQSKDIGSSKNIADIVGQFCKHSKNIIAELNGTIIPRADWDKTPVKDADTIELVSFVGGG